MDSKAIFLSLSKHNWDQWYGFVVGLLRQNNVHLHIAPDATKRLSPLESADDAAKKLYEEKANKAAGIILTYLDENEQKFVDREDLRFMADPFEIISKLKIRHLENSHIEREAQEAALRAVVYKQGTSLERHIEIFKQAIQAFKNVGGSKTELEFIRIFINSINDDPTWEPHCNAIKTSEKIFSEEKGTYVDNKLTLDAVTRQMKEIWTNKQTKKKFNPSATPPQDEAHMQKEKESTPTICRNCHDFGHYANKCPFPKGFYDNLKKLMLESMESSKGGSSSSRENKKEKKSMKKKNASKQSDSSHKTDEKPKKEKPEAWFTPSISEKSRDIVYLDNCTTTSIFNDLKWFNDDFIHYDHPAGLGNFKESPKDQGSDIFGEGTVRLVFKHKGQRNEVLLK